MLSMLDTGQLTEDDIMESLDIVESLDIIELSMLDDDQQSMLEDIIIELSIIELDEESWAKPGMAADAKAPATSRAAATASSFFISASREQGVCDGKPNHAKPSPAAHKRSQPATAH